MIFLIGLKKTCRIMKRIRFSTHIKDVHTFSPTLATLKKKFISLLMERMYLFQLLLVISSKMMLLNGCFESLMVSVLSR